MSADQIYQTALDAYEAGDFLRATGALEPLARAGDVKALTIMGTWYTLPEMLDSEKAVKYLTAAASRGNGHAAHNLATLYVAPPPGIEVSHEKARQWYQVAYDSGFEATVSSDPLWWKREAT